MSLQFRGRSQFLGHRSLSYPVMDFDYQSMEDELTCPVCLELYADPLMLPCSHSVCKKCLQDILDSKAVCKVDKGIECPSCRKVVKITKEKLNDLPRNLALENIVIRYSEERSKSLRKSLSLESPVLEILNSPVSDTVELPEFPTESKQNCELCEGSSVARAAWFCVQCEVAYCHACFSRFHPRRGSLARHKLKQPSEKEMTDKPSFCSDHETEHSAIFCDNCKVMVCHLCVCDDVGKHSGHKILAPDTAYRKIKEVAVETKECSDSLLVRLQENRSKVNMYAESMQDLYDATCQQIEVQYKRLLNDLTVTLNLEKDRILSSLSSSIADCKQHVTTYVEGSQQCERHLEELSAACHNLALEESHKLTLSRAAEVEPLTVQLTTSKTETETLNSQHESLLKDKSVQQVMDSAVDEFCSHGFTTLTAILEDKQEEVIIPHILSPSSPGKSDGPRIQNKCLITWGFKSTSFTAEPLNHSTTWTVAIERNTGHLGNFTSGYLFGIGISSEVLNVKDLVGMTEGSYGVVCMDGSLFYSHSGCKEELVTLGNLPLTVTVKLYVGHPDYTVLTYKLGASGQSVSVLGKRVISNISLKEKVHPVFTVSQRVKLLFPSLV